MPFANAPPVRGSDLESTATKHVPEWNSLWGKVLDRLRQDYGPGVFDTWLASLTFSSATEGHIQVSTPTRLVRDRVAGRYAHRIEQLLGELTSSFVSLELIVIAAQKPMYPVTPRRVENPAKFLSRPVSDAAPRRLDQKIDPRLGFTHFAVTETNKFVFDATRSFALNQLPAKLLYIHGEFGTGKSHLLNAIAFEAWQSEGARVLYFRAEDFMRRVMLAQSNQSPAFREELNCVDLILVDDLHHLAGRVVAMTEFFHVMNTLLDQNRRVAVTANEVPAFLKGWSDEVRSNLGGGLVLQVARPDAATRLAILVRKHRDLVAQLPRANFPVSILELIANTLEATPRELTTVLMQLVTYADLTGKAVTEEVAWESINCLTHASISRQGVTIEQIQKKTADYFQLEPRELHSARRVRRVARPRQVAMYLCRELTGRSTPEIGRRFGGRDHTTVIHACRRIEQLTETDADFKQVVEFLRTQLQPRAKA